MDPSFRPGGKGWVIALAASQKVRLNYHPYADTSDRQNRSLGRMATFKTKADAIENARRGISSGKTGFLLTSTKWLRSNQHADAAERMLRAALSDNEFISNASREDVNRIVNDLCTITADAHPEETLIILRSNPGRKGDAGLLLREAVILGSLDRNDEAIFLLEREMEQHPIFRGNSYVITKLAALYMELGRNQHAKELLDNIASLRALSENEKRLLADANRKSGSIGQYESVERFLNAPNPDGIITIPPHFVHLSEKIRKIEEGIGNYSTNVLIMSSFSHEQSSLNDALLDELNKNGFTSHAPRNIMGSMKNRGWESLCANMIGSKYGIAIHLGGDEDEFAVLGYGFMRALGKPVAILADPVHAGIFNRILPHTYAVSDAGSVRTALRNWLADIGAPT